MSCESCTLILVEPDGKTSLVQAYSLAIALGFGLTKGVALRYYGAPLRGARMGAVEPRSCTLITANCWIRLSLVYR
jgi:hypothetical protein